MHRELGRSETFLNRSWDLKERLTIEIGMSGGFVNTHAHLDRAYTINPQTLHLANATLQQKWGLVDEIKRNSSCDQIYDRMAFAVEKMAEQGVKVIGTFIDVDEVIGDKAMKAAQKLRETYNGYIKLVFANQTLKGVLDPNAHEWFKLGAQFVDIIGGLPRKDEGRESEALDIILTTAKSLGKMAHIHVDQFNSASECETELLVNKTKEHGMEGKVVAIHGVSIAAQNRHYRYELYKKMQEAGVMLICCPTAWIDSRRSDELAPTHNAIAPIEEMIPLGITVGIGTDNIADVYKPFTNGDMWTELRFLLESCHYYDMDELVRISTTNGRKVLGLPTSGHFQ